MIDGENEREKLPYKCTLEVNDSEPKEREREKGSEPATSLQRRSQPLVWRATDRLVCATCLKPTSPSCRNELR